jgi:hypothetical protein
MTDRDGSAPKGGQIAHQSSWDLGPTLLPHEHPARRHRLNHPGSAVLVAPSCAKVPAAGLLT